MFNLNTETAKLLQKHDYSIKSSRKYVMDGDRVSSIEFTIKFPPAIGRAAQTITYKAVADEFNEFADFYIDGQLEYAQMKIGMYGVVWNLILMDWCLKNSYNYNPLWVEPGGEERNDSFCNIQDALEALMEFNGCNSLASSSKSKYHEDMQLISKSGRLAEAFQRYNKVRDELRQKLPSEYFGTKTRVGGEPVPDASEKRADGANNNSPVDFRELEAVADVRINLVNDAE